MTPDELEDKLQRAAGEAYAKGIPAETVHDKLNNVAQRMERLMEAE